MTKAMKIILKISDQILILKSLAKRTKEKENVKNT